MRNRTSGFVSVPRRRLLAWAGGGAVYLLTGGSRAQEADAATMLFNEIRHANGLGAMAPDARLEAVALDQARRMAEYRKVSHMIGRGNSFAARLRRAGVHGPAAENLCAGQRDARGAFRAWMHSPGHRRNMLDPAFAHYGLACAAAKEKPGYMYWAMVLWGSESRPGAS